MQNGVITTQLSPHDRLCFVPTSKILIPPSKSGKMRRRLARQLVGRQVYGLGGGVACCTFVMDTHRESPASGVGWQGRALTPR